MSRLIYLDNNATTRVAPEVVEAMKPFWETYYGNPASLHFLGGQVERALADAREQVAALLGCQPLEIVFTSGGTEGNNTAISGALSGLSPKRQILTTAVEHPSVQAPLEQIGQRGYSITRLPVNREGLIELEQVRQSLTDETALVSVMYANNETGVVFPIEEIGQIVKARGILFHVDAVQAVGKIPLSLAHSTIDLLTMAGHKLHGPKGIGVLFIRRGVRLAPLMMGGHQERGWRAGTPAVPNAIGLGCAAQLAQKSLAEENARVQCLRNQLEEWMLRTIPGTERNGHPDQRISNTSSICFGNLQADALLLALSTAGICVSTGSACTSGSIAPSHVLLAMGRSAQQARASLRFSLSRYTTAEEIAVLMESLPGLVQRLRRLDRQSKGPVRK